MTTEPMGERAGDERPEERVRAALDRLGVEAEIQWPGNTETAPAAAAAVGCELGAIVKSLVFLAAGDPVLVLAPGDRQVSDAKLAALLGVPRKKIRFADAEAAFAITGYRVGGVPPFGHRTPLPTYMDEGLERYETVWAAAGSSNSLFGLSLADLRRATEARVADLSRRPDDTTS